MNEINSFQLNKGQHYTEVQNLYILC